MLYTLKVELATRHGLTQAELRARIVAALMYLEDLDVPPGHDSSIIPGAWWLDVPGEHGISSKDAIRERAARAARLTSAETQAELEQRLDGALPWSDTCSAGRYPDCGCTVGYQRDMNHGSKGSAA